jgi:hypothetical protein
LGGIPGYDYHHPAIIPSYRVKNCFEVKFVNFGLATSRRKNDCSRDLRVARVANILVQDPDALIELPEQLQRVTSWPKIYSDYMDGLEGNLRANARILWLSHQEKLLNFQYTEKVGDKLITKDFLLPVRLPGRDFEACDPADWEGRMLHPPTDQDLSIMTRGKFDNLGHRLKSEWTLDLFKRSLRQIRSYNKERCFQHNFLEEFGALVHAYYPESSPLSNSLYQELSVSPYVNYVMPKTPVLNNRVDFLH